MHKKYEPEDFRVFERQVEQYVRNWAACDTPCNQTARTFVTMCPAHLGKLKRWVGSPLHWIKHASAVTLIIPARKRLFPNDIFGIADILLTDKDDKVPKGCDWILKAANQVPQREVFNYVGIA